MSVNHVASEDVRCCILTTRWMTGSEPAGRVVGGTFTSSLRFKQGHVSCMRVGAVTHRDKGCQSNRVCAWPAPCHGRGCGNWSEVKRAKPLSAPTSVWVHRSRSGTKMGHLIVAPSSVLSRNVDDRFSNGTNARSEYTSVSSWTSIIFLPPSSFPPTFS